MTNHMTSAVRPALVPIQLLIQYISRVLTQWQSGAGVMLLTHLHPQPISRRSGDILLRPLTPLWREQADCFRNVMANAQKPDIVFRRNGRVYLNRQGRSFSRLLAAEVCACAVVMVLMLDTACSTGGVKGNGYPLHSAVSSSLPPPVRHRVPSRFNWTIRLHLLPSLQKFNSMDSQIFYQHSLFVVQNSSINSSFTVYTSLTTANRSLCGTKQIFICNFDVLLTVHLSVISVINQLNAQILVL